MVMSIKGKGATRLHQVMIRKTNNPESLLKCRKGKHDDVKTKGRKEALGLAQGISAYCLSGIRHEGDVIFIWALEWNVGTWSLDVKGKVEDGRPIEMKVPKQDTGAEQFVVVMKSVKADEAKELRYPALVAGQPLQKEMKPVMPLVGQNFTS